ncbi:MAG TPA: hypothetical protein VFF27_17310 [Bacteroidia bacterium]|nr:hypothetical protein [Bacteroidia bacterium]
MKTIKTIFSILCFISFLSSCTSDKGNSNNTGDSMAKSHHDEDYHEENHAGGNGSVIEGSNKDDYYQMRGFGDSIPDSVRELKRQDSIRIKNSPDRNK